MQAKESRQRSLVVMVGLVAGVVASLAIPAAWATTGAARANVAAAAASAGEAAAAVDDTSPKAKREIVLYYFHGARRCKTCLSIEASAKEAVDSRFERELKTGALQWKVVNIDEPTNEHYRQDFGLVSSSLVLVEMAGERVARHEVLQQAWTLSRDEARFAEYVQQAVLGYLN